MKLEELGFTEKIKKFIIDPELKDFEIGRIISEHKERYIVQTENGEYDAEITGNMRFTAKDRYDFPAVGDWVTLKVYEGDLAIIHKIIPRFSILRRQAVGQYGEVQLIAVNIDYAFIIQAVDRDFNLNRIERYLTICNSSKVIPIIILSKIDLIEEYKLEEIITIIKNRVSDVPIIPISNESKIGYEAINEIIQKGKTYCMLGSSGVGKSTLLNNLSGNALMKTGKISQSTNKGKHVTSHRELVLLSNGGILIDNPGMREVGVADSTDGLEITFNKILSLAENCKFKDCTHKNEIGCAVIAALEKGELEQNQYDNYIKMEKERAYYESTAAERRKKGKELGKIIKDYYKKNNNKKRF